jgi:hypothetical protein
MPKVTHVKAAQQRYEMVPVLDDDGQQVVTETARKTQAKPGRDSRQISRRQTRPDLSQPLPPRNCDYDHQPIAVGTPYKWMAPRSGPFGGRKLYRHEGCPTWQQWEYSDSLGARLAKISYEFDNAVADATSESEVEDALATAADAARELAEEKRESAQSIEDGFQHPTSQSEELADQADQLDSWADEIETVSVPDFPEPEEDTACDDCNGEPGNTECDTCQGRGTYTPEEPTENQVDEWRSEVESETSIVGEPPV